MARGRQTTSSSAIRTFSAEPPSSTSEAGGRQEDVWQLTCFARRPAGYWEMDCQQGGRAAPKGAGLLELDGRGAAQPLEQLRSACTLELGGLAC